MNFQVRRFDSSDLDELMGVERASFGRDAYGRNLFAEYAHACGALFLVAEADARGSSSGLAGYSIACICRSRRELANLISIAVAPHARRRGVASLLLMTTIRRLKLRGVLRFTLMVRQSNAGAIRFYERHGFARLRRSKGYYEDGEDGVLMRRILKTE